MPRLADHPGGIGPLTRRGRWVVVDSHPICAACGRGVMPTGPDSWRHVPEGRTFTGRSRWLPPIPLHLLTRLERYATASNTHSMSPISCPRRFAVPSRRARTG